MLIAGASQVQNGSGHCHKFLLKNLVWIVLRYEISLCTQIKSAIPDIPRHWNISLFKIQDGGGSCSWGKDMPISQDVWIYLNQQRRHSTPILKCTTASYKIKMVAGAILNFLQKATSLNLFQLWSQNFCLVIEIGILNVLKWWNTDNWHKYSTQTQDIMYIIPDVHYCFQQNSTWPRPPPWIFI